MLAPGITDTTAVDSIRIAVTGITVAGFMAEGSIIGTSVAAVSMIAAGAGADSGAGTIFAAAGDSLATVFTDMGSTVETMAGMVGATMVRTSAAGMVEKATAEAPTVAGMVAETTAMVVATADGANWV